MSLTLQSIPGIAGLKKFSPASVFIVGPRNWLKASPPAARAIASCRSKSRPWLVSIGDETLVSVATLEVASDAKDVSPAPKPLTKNKAVRIEVVRYILSTPFQNHRTLVTFRKTSPLSTGCQDVNTLVSFTAPSLRRSNGAATECDIVGTPVSRRRQRLNNCIPR